MQPSCVPEDEPDTTRNGRDALFPRDRAGSATVLRRAKRWGTVARPGLVGARQGRFC